MGKIGQCGGPYYAISEEQGDGQEAQLGGKCCQIPKGTAYDRATWYEKNCFANQINIWIPCLVSPRPQQSLQTGQLKVHKICPLPVKSFIGRKKILDKMCHYFDTDHKGQHVFVLHGLGGSGKSQLAFKFLEDSKNHQRYNSFKTFINF